METNKKTVQSYEDHIDEYIKGTPQEVSGPIKEWIDNSLRLIPADGRILELGSAFGRDADYFESKGYRVDRTDVVEGFVDLLTKQGHKARQLNALTDELGANFDMVFANAVFLHFTIEELKEVLAKTHTALNENGILVFSVKRGSGSKWSEDKLGAPRFFQYWELEPLEQLLKEENFAVVESGSKRSEHRNQDWLHIIARKP